MGVSNKRTLTKTRRKTRDLDQIQNDIISTKHLANYKGTKAQEDLPGLGRHYCVECARWFETSTTLLAHKRAKPHKRRLKQLKEADSAAESKADSHRHKHDHDVGDVDMAT